MAKSSINIQTASSHCFAHNDRSDKVTYLIDDPKLNECSTPKNEAQLILKQYVKEAEQFRKSNGLRAMKSDTIKAVEAVVNLNAGHNLADVQRLATRLEQEFGFRAVQIAVHRDEGHIAESGKKEKNYHAHIVMCNLTPDGKTIQRTLGRSGMKRIQDITAEELGMERGKSADITGAKHVDHREYKFIKQTEAEYEREILELRNRALNAEKIALEAQKGLSEAQSTILAQSSVIEQLQSDLATLKTMYTEDRQKLIASGVAKPSDYQALKKAHDDLKTEVLEVSRRNNIPTVMSEVAQIKVIGSRIDTLKAERDTLKEMVKKGTDEDVKHSQTPKYSGPKRG